MQSLLQDNFLFQLTWAYGMGIVASLTPCVFPLIPITLSVFGATSMPTRRQAFLVSLTYVLGMCLTYTALGVLTVKLGMVFGSLLGNIYVVLFFSAFLLALGLHTLGVIELPFNNLQSKANKVGGRGYIGAFLMGLVSGGVAAPCVGPVLILILAQVAKAGSLAKGISLLLSYSFGLGTLFLVLGTFSSLTKKLPKSGNWLYAVKYLIAVSIFAVIFFLLAPHIATFVPATSKNLWLVFAVAALLLSYVTLKQQRSGRQLISALLLGFIAVQYLSTPAPQNLTQVAKGAALDQSSLTWLTDAEQALQLGSKKNLPIMIDLYADWCVACKELEHTFSDQTVKTAVKDILVTARINFTSESDTTQALAEKYGVIGLPCILFLKPDGQEIPDGRLTGFVTPEQFLAHLNKIKGLI